MSPSTSSGQTAVLFHPTPFAHVRASEHELSPGCCFVKPPREDASRPRLVVTRGSVLAGLDQPDLLTARRLAPSFPIAR